MIYQKYIARCYRVYQHERNENASFLSIFNGGGRPKWRFSNFPRFWKNSSALGSFNCIFENNSLKALFGQNMKKLKILKLSPDSRYLQKVALLTHTTSGPPAVTRDWKTTLLMTQNFYLSSCFSLWFCNEKLLRRKKGENENDIPNVSRRWTRSISFLWSLSLSVCVASPFFYLR